MKKTAKKSELTTILRVTQALAGDKLPKVLELSVELRNQGKDVGRAIADALETLKLPTVIPDKKQDNA